MHCEKKPVTPEDVIADGTDHRLINGQNIRKGTVAAFIANIAIVEDQTATAEEQQDALDMLKNLAPSIVLIGLTNYVTFKNPQVEQILLDAKKVV